VFEQVAALPDDALDAYAQVLDVLEVAPWNGPPHHQTNPDGAVRRWLFGPGGAGHLVYLIEEDRQLVHLVQVLWLGPDPTS